MVQVSWDRAQADLAGITPALAEQIRREAERTLHVMPPPCPDGTADGGQSNGLMWHRCARHSSDPGHPDDIHDSIDEPDGGPHDYFVFYERQGSDQAFSVVAVRSNQQIASMWAQLNQRLLEFIGTPPP